METELCFNGRFLITKYRGQVPEITPERVQHLKETMGVSDKDIRNMQGSIYKGLEFRTIDPSTGEVFGEQTTFFSLKLIKTRPTRLERATFGSTVRCSIQLSYGPEVLATTT